MGRSIERSTFKCCRQNKSGSEANGHKGTDAALKGKEEDAKRLVQRTLEETQ